MPLAPKLLFGVASLLLLTTINTAECCAQVRPTQDAESKAVTLLNEAQELQKNNNLDGALEKYKQVLALSSESNYTFNQYAAYKRIGAILFKKNELNEAESVFENALKLAQRLRQQDLIYDSFFSLSLLNIYQGKFAQTEQRLMEAAKVAQAAAINTEADTDELLRQGYGYLANARSTEPKQAQQDSSEVRVLGDLKEDELLRGIAALKGAAIIAPAALRSLAVLVFHQALAELHFDLGEYQHALEHATIAGRIARSLSAAHKDMSAVDALRVLGDVHEALANDAEAVKTYVEAVTTLSKIPNGSVQDIIPSFVPLKVYAGLARAYMRRRQFAEAEKILDTADRYAKSMGEFGEIANMLGVARARGDLEYARGNRTRAFAEYNKTIDQKLLNLLDSVAEVTNAKCSETRGWDSIFKPEDRISLRTALGRTLIERLKPEQALCELSRAVSIIEQLRLSLDDLSLRQSILSRKIQIYGSAVEALYQLHKQQKPVTDRELAQFGPSAKAVSFYISESAHARTFADRLGASVQRNNNVRNLLPKELLLKEQQSRAALATLLDLNKLPAVLNPAGKQERRGERIAKARQELDNIVSKLRTSNNLFTSILYPRPATWSETVSQLSPPENLLEYFVTPNATYCWLVTSDGKGEFFKIDITETALRDTIMKFREPFEKGLRRVRDDKLLRQLYDLLLSQPLEWLKQNSTKTFEATRLVFVPDNVLYLLPFDVLLDRNEKFIGDQYITNYYPSATTMLQVSSVGSGPWSSDILIVGDTVEPGVTINVGGRQFGYLQNGQREVEEIAKLFGVSTNCTDLLTRRCASKAALLKKGSQGDLSKYRILHFSTHAFAHLAELEPSIVLSEGTKPKDALLTMSEVPLLNLRADIVTLSACQTALGQNTEPIPGEGIVGLSQAFFYAGARSVLASLWEVDAASTSELMKKFYQKLRSQKGRPDKAAALFMARKDLSKSTKDSPYLWGAFILLGKSQ